MNDYGEKKNIEKFCNRSAKEADGERGDPTNLYFLCITAHGMTTHLFKTTTHVNKTKNAGPI